MSQSHRESHHQHYHEQHNKRYNKKQEKQKRTTKHLLHLNPSDNKKRSRIARVRGSTHSHMQNSTVYLREAMHMRCMAKLCRPSNRSKACKHHIGFRSIHVGSIAHPSPFTSFASFTLHQSQSSKFCSCGAVRDKRWRPLSATWAAHQFHSLQG